MEIFKMIETPGYHLSGGFVMGRSSVVGGSAVTCGIDQVRPWAPGALRGDKSALFTTEALTVAAFTNAAATDQVVITDVDVPNGPSAVYVELRT